MKASEVIKELKELIKEEGDLEVATFNAYYDLDECVADYIYRDGAYIVIS